MAGHTEHAKEGHSVDNLPYELESKSLKGGCIGEGSRTLDGSSDRIEAWQITKILGLDSLYG